MAYSGRRRLTRRFLPPGSRGQVQEHALIRALRDHDALLLKLAAPL